MWWPRRWLRARRPARWIGRTSSFQRTKGQWAVAPLPTPRELLGVVGVGSTESVNGNALTLLALERYRELDIVTFWFRRPYVGGRSLFPELEIGVEGAGDAARRVWSMGGSGGGGPEDMTFRHAYALAPPSAGADEIVVVVNRIDWIDHHLAEPRVVKSEPGPWRFAIRL